MATYYVRTDGHDGATGLNDTNNATTGAWLTLGKAASTVAAGSTVIVKAGTYAPLSGNICTFWVSGSSGNPITFRSENPAVYDIGGSNHAILDGAFTSQVGFHLNGNSYINFDGFEIKRSTGIGGSFGILGQSSDYVNITRCHIHHIASDQVNSDLYGNCAICNSGGGVQSHNWTIDSCVFHDIGRIGNTAPGAWASAPLGSADSTIYLETSYITISNNLFYNTDTAQYGFRGKMVQNLNSSTPYAQISNCVIVNNTVYGDTTGNYGPYFLFYNDNSSYGMTNCVVANNLAVGTGATTVFLRYYNDANCSGNIMTNNITSAGTKQQNAGTGDSDVFTDTNNTASYSSDPFTAKASYDFTLVADSAPIDAADATYLPALDFLGTSRPQGTYGDIGAYEYVSDVVRTYSRGSYGSLPSDDTDLTTIYSVQDYLDVALDDGDRVGESGNGYILHQFKEVAGTYDTKMIIHCNLQAPLAPSDYPVYLQCYDRVTAGGMWVTVVTNNAAAANTDFDMDFTLDSGTTPTFANCKDEDGVISSRVYQTNVPLS